MTMLQDFFFLLFSREKGPSSLACISSDVSEEFSAGFYIVLGFPKIAKSAIKRQSNALFKKVVWTVEEHRDLCCFWFHKMVMAWLMNIHYLMQKSFCIIFHCFD